MDTQVFAAFLVDILDKIPGKKAFQKMVYFGQVLGIPLDHSYKMYFYGPYSETVAEALDTAIEENTISQLNAFSFGRGEDFEITLNQGFEEIVNNIGNLEKLITLFGDMSPSDLELYATVHFTDNSQKNIYNNHDKESIIEVVERIKGTKFKKKQIENAYNKLEKWGLLS